MARFTFSCIDAHTCGNPVRVVSGGGPQLSGASMSERRQHFLNEFDWIRTGLMFEPRGHDMMSGSILYPPTRPDCDVAILFIETSGCLPMCGHGTIGTVTIAIENGLVRPKKPGELRLDTPAGLVVATYEQVGDYVESVRLTNVPGFLHSEGLVTADDVGNWDAGQTFAGTARSAHEHVLAVYREFQRQLEEVSRLLAKSDQSHGAAEAASRKASQQAGAPLHMPQGAPPHAGVPTQQTAPSKD